MTVRPGADVIQRATDAAPLRTCSKLSRTRSSRRGARKASSVESSAAPSRAGSPSAPATALGTRAGSVIGASSAMKTPSGNASLIDAATSIASLVLPTPPGPSRVTNRRSSRRSPILASDSSRPTKASIRSGRFVGTSTAALSGPKPVGRPGPSRTNTSIGSARSLSRCRPRCRKRRSPGRLPATSSATTDDARTWPPVASVSRRAHWKRADPL